VFATTPTQQQAQTAGVQQAAATTPISVANPAAVALPSNQAATPRKSADFPQTGLPLSNGPLGLGGSASPVPVQPGPGPAPPAPSPAPAALPPPSLPPPYSTPMQVSFAFQNTCFCYLGTACTSQPIIFHT
jgi:hypothetical protein